MSQFKIKHLIYATVPVALFFATFSNETFDSVVGAAVCTFCFLGAGILGAIRIGGLFSRFDRAVQSRSIYHFVPRFQWLLCDGVLLILVVMGIALANGILSRQSGRRAVWFFGLVIIAGTLVGWMIRRKFLEPSSRGVE